MLHSTDYWEYILLMLVQAVTASSTHHQSFLQLHRIQSEGSTLLTIHESSCAQLILLLHIRKLLLILHIRHNFLVTRQCGMQSIRYISATSASQFLHVIVLQPSMYWSCTWYKVHSKVSCAQYQGVPLPTDLHDILHSEVLSRCWILRLYVLCCVNYTHTDNSIDWICQALYSVIFVLVIWVVWFEALHRLWCLWM